MLTQVVFGGATGIGRAIVQRLARRPGRLIVLDKNEAELAKLPKSIEGPAKLDCLTVDVLDTDGLMALPQRVLKDGAALDVLAFNAGIYPTVTVEESQPKDWDLVSGLNARACYFAIRAFLPQLAKVEARHDRADEFDHRQSHRRYGPCDLWRVQGGDERHDALDGARIRQGRHHHQCGRARRRRHRAGAEGPRAPERSQDEIAHSR